MTGTSRRTEKLEQGLHDARRTSQKRAKRVSALKERVGELEEQIEELADAFMVLITATGFLEVSALRSGHSGVTEKKWANASIAV